MKKSIALILLSLILFACSKDKKKVQKFNSNIESLTRGVISRDASIKLVLVESSIDLKKKVGKKLANNVFDFSPSIEGKISYLYDGKTIVFKPKQHLISGTQYTAKLKFRNISEEFKKLEDFHFSFSVPYNRLINFDGKWQLTNSESPLNVFYESSFGFSSYVSLEMLKKKLEITVDGKKIKYKIRRVTSDNSFEVTTDDIERTSEDVNFLMVFDKDLGFKNDERTGEMVPAMDEMKVFDFNKIENGQKPKIRFEYSDEIDFMQDIKTFVKVEPDVNAKISKIGKRVFIEGDFEFGGTYKITINKGVRSRWGDVSANDVIKKVTFRDLEPQIVFASNGVFLPTSKKGKLRFLSANVSKVHIEIKKVFPSSIRKFIKTEQLASLKNRTNDFNSTYTSMSGVVIINKTFEIGIQKNKWLMHEIDFSDMFNNRAGIYLVRLNFNPKDIIVKLPHKQDKEVYTGQHGFIYKPLIVNDISLTLKRVGHNETIYAANVLTAEPMEGVKVVFSGGRFRYSANEYTNIKTAITDSHGIATVKGMTSMQIVATKGKNLSIIKKSDSRWLTENYKIGGVNLSTYNNLRAFLYTDRGVYRPGDTIHLSLIAKYANNTFPSNHPISLVFSDPKGTKVYDEILRKGLNGMYSFKIPTKSRSKTGLWTVRVKIANSYFFKNIRIETIVPMKLKIRIETDKKEYLLGKSNVKVKLDVKYLFGNVANNLKYSVNADLKETKVVFPKYSSYSFYNPTRKFNSELVEICSSKLDSKGKASFTWKFPKYNIYPSCISAYINVSVLEKGGRPNISQKIVKIKPYKYYVGYKKSTHRNDYSIKIGDRLRVPIIMINNEGERVFSKSVKYKIYFNDSSWWWYYDNGSSTQRQLKYKSSDYTELIYEKTLKSLEDNSEVSFAPSKTGIYYVEIQDLGDGGHSTGFFMSASEYTNSKSTNKNEGTLQISSDKKSYLVGETATIEFSVPDKATAYITIDKGDIEISKDILQLNKSPNNKYVYKFKITKEMSPNIYLAVSLMQPYKNMSNDRPLRMFGILPLKVTDLSTKPKISIVSKDVLQPNKKFSIELQTSNSKKMDFTISIVDEGLLSLTKFVTPNPWKYFNKKIRLQTQFFDNLAQFIGITKGEIFRSFSIGGDDLDDSGKDKFKKKSKKRFKPVVFFRGPLSTDENGYAKLEFVMPEYIGEVRVMVIATHKNMFATAEKFITVKSDLMILPSLPRTLKVMDKFKMAVTAFSDVKDIKNVVVQITTSDNIEVLGNKIKNAKIFEGETELYFNLRAKKIKKADGFIKLKCTSGRYTAEYSTQINIGVPSNFITEAISYKIAKGTSVNIKIPKIGVKGSNTAKLTLALYPNLSIEHRLQYLIRYPYGCIEQTTSSVFPQLMMKNVVKLTAVENIRIDDNINKGLERLKIFQTYNGGFSYWPGGRSTSLWGTNYATNFIFEAKHKGYSIDNDMYKKVLRFQIIASKERRGDLQCRIYRLYTLALVSKAPISELNIIKENCFKKLNNTEKWMLALAYTKLKQVKIAESIIQNIHVKVKTYNDFGRNYGSTMRDKSVILMALCELRGGSEKELLAKEISIKLSGKNWYSTQTTSFMLMAMSKFLDNIGVNINNDNVVIGKLILSNGKVIKINNRVGFNIDMKSEIGKTVKLVVDKSSTTNTVYPTIAVGGQPLLDTRPAISKNLKLKVEWFNGDGDRVDETKASQGDVLYGIYTVKNNSKYTSIDEVVLEQIIPSGWEIENLRFLKRSLPSWIDQKNTKEDDYMDIKDDRIAWFFDIRRSLSYYKFIMKINVVTPGEYYLPPAVVKAMYNEDYKAKNITKKCFVK